MIEYFRKQLCIKWYNFIVHNWREFPYNIKYMKFPKKVITLLGVFYFSISVLILLNGRVGNRKVMWNEWKISLKTNATQSRISLSTSHETSTSTRNAAAVCKWYDDKDANTYASRYTGFMQSNALCCISCGCIPWPAHKLTHFGFLWSACTGHSLFPGFCKRRDIPTVSP